MSSDDVEQDLDALFRRFNTLSESVRALQGELTALHAVLAQGPDRGLELEAEALRRRRDDEMIEWATVALAWRESGGRIVLEDPPDSEESADATLHSLPEVDTPEASQEQSIDLSILDDVVIGPGWSQQARVDPGFDVEVVQKIVDRLSAPTADLDYHGMLAEAAALHNELVHIDDWKELPRTVQRALTGLVASRMRFLQDDAPAEVKVILQMQLRKDFARLTQFSNEQQPGWVTGLSRSHTPENGTWISDAEFWWNTLRREVGGFVMDAERASLNPEVALDELGTLLEGAPAAADIRRGATRALNAGVAPEDPRLTRLLMSHLPALRGDKGLKRLRRSVRQAIASERADTGPLDDDEDDGPLPPDWPWFEFTRGRTAVLVGGDEREQRRVEIEAAFEFEALEWVGGYDIRGIQSLAERIQGGSVDMVLMLARFISHKVTDILLPACRSAQVDWVMVRQGYGINQLRFAVERYLADRVESTPAGGGA